MEANPLLRDLGLIVLAAVFFVLVARRVGIPSIVAYILAGLALGPLLGMVELTHTMELIAEVGIILLLFLVGLELSLEKIRDVGGVAVMAALAQMTVTSGAVAAIAWSFGLSGGDVLFLGVALTFSSTVVVVKLLDQLKALGQRHGRIAVGILLVQDVVVVVVLTFVTGLAGAGEVTAGEMVRGVSVAFIGMAALLVGAALAAQTLLPRLFAWLASSQEALFIWSLFWCFLLVLGSEVLHLSLELGGFIAGVTLAQLPYNHDLRRRVHPLMNFFVAVFFVTLGIQMELGAAVEAWPLVAALVVFTLLAKPPLVAWLVRMMGESPLVGLRAGLTLGQSSEFSFILAALALTRGLIDELMLSIVGAVGLLTMGVSSFSIASGDRLVGWLAKRGLLPLLTGGRGDPEDTVLAPEGGSGEGSHVIVVGMNSLGRRIVEELARHGEQVLAIDTDPTKLRGLPCAGLLGNAEYLSVLEEAGLDRAKLLVSALQIEDTNRLLAFRCRAVGTPCAIHAFDREAMEEIAQLEPTFLIDSRRVGIERITRELQREGIFG